MRTISTSLLFLTAIGCSVNGLSQSWELDRVRVLGVRAVPAEPQPGEQTVFESLVDLPDGIEMETMIWFACLPEDGTAFGCSTDLSALEDLDTSEDLTPEESFELFTELEQAGVIGIEPFWAPTWTPPLDALDGLTEEQQLEGLSATVNLSLIPTEGGDELDLETAFKRVPVSRATHPNHNPKIIGIKVDGIQYTPGADFEAAPGQVYEIDPVLSEDSIETYTFINSAGECEERVEEPISTGIQNIGTTQESTKSTRTFHSPSPTLCIHSRASNGRRPLKISRASCSSSPVTDGEAWHGLTST